MREALIALEIAGCVEVRMGAGIYVREAAVSGADSASTLGLGDSPMELMQARAMLEGSLMAPGCVRASPEGLRAVREAIDEMRQAMQTGRSALDADRRFHLAIAALAGNSVLERLVAELFDGRYSPIALQLSAQADTRQNWQDALREHERILQALETRDALAAQVAMQHHERILGVNQLSDWKFGAGGLPPVEQPGVGAGGAGEEEVLKRRGPTWTRAVWDDCAW